MPFSSLCRIRSVPMLASVVTVKPASRRTSTQAVQQPQLLSLTTWIAGALSWAMEAKGVMQTRLVAETSRRRRVIWVIRAVLIVFLHLFLGDRRINATELRCCRADSAGPALP